MEEKIKKVLFLEDKSYYEQLGISLSSSKYEYIYNGNKMYKIKYDELKKYAAIVSTHYTNPISNYIILKAKKMRIKTILVSDGVYDYSNSYLNPLNQKYRLNLYDPIIHDIFLCTGKIESALFRKKGVKVMEFLPKRVLVNENRKLELAQNKEILITTANTAYFNEVEKISLISLLKKIKDILRDEGVIFKFRIFDETLISELNIKPEKNLIEGSFEDVLKNFDYVITTPSSISITSMYHNRVVGQLIYRDTPQLLQTGWNIFDSPFLKETIKSFFTASKERLEFQDKMLKNYIEVQSPSKVLERALDEKEIVRLELFIDQNMNNMIDSCFNFNMEYSIRRLYLKFKKNIILKKLRKKVK